MASAAILAGGRATRFDGRAKGDLRVDGRTILDRQLTALAELTDDILIVGGHGASPAGVRAVADRLPGCGPLGGLDAALTAARDELVVVVACDMPFVEARLLRRLLALSGAADPVNLAGPARPARPASPALPALPALPGPSNRSDLSRLSFRKPTAAIIRSAPSTHGAAVPRLRVGSRTEPWR